MEMAPIDIFVHIMWKDAFLLIGNFQYCITV